MSTQKTKSPRKRLIARVKCKGDTCNANEKTILKEITSCIDAAEVSSEENKSCSYGCLGYGTCMEVCPFDAIEVVDGLAIINQEKCKGCRKCVKVCPRDVIAMVPVEQEVFVDCNSEEFGKAVKEKCKVGCIGCKMCVRVCPFFAMDFTDKLAHINYDNCTNCKLCAEKCPTKAITADLVPRGIADISKDKCIGCTVCAQICPVAAIEGHRGETHVVNKGICIGCTVCAKKCPVSAIDMVQNSDVSKSKSKDIDIYEKQIIKYYNSFDDIKNLNETIDYSENYNSDHFHGSLSLYKASRLENADIFEVVYRGQLSNSSK